ncbi:MAG: protein kinase, partial [Deltaproteobacteria bacterium]|nr:protein kinase [Deltaproteobacteria bacterium]
MAVMPEPGTTLDGFLLEDRIHSGGMAVLYRVARDEGDFPALMKVPRLGFGEPASSVISFEVEQTVLSVLKGPHVPRFVASGESEEHPYLVMEHVDGRPLSDWVERAPLEPDEVARLGAALGTALHALHLQEVIHLDVKPGNVIFRPSGEAVLIDFGLAHHAHYPDLLAEEWSRPIGSAPYIAPEQVLGVRCDPRSDIFALGVVLYELATGRMPFGSPKNQSGLRKRLWRDPLPPRSLVKHLPAWLQEVIFHCLEVNAAERYASAAQVALDLAHPDQVVVGERGSRLRRDGPWKVFRRWFRAAGFEAAPCPQPSVYLSSAPIVLAAVATTHTNEAVFQAVRDTVKRLVGLDAQTRLTCVSVIPPAPEASVSSAEDTSTTLQIRHRAMLRHWAEPLELPPEKLSFHVLESNDPAQALLDYARLNHVAHIVIGAPPPRQAVRGRLAGLPGGGPAAGAPQRLPLLQLLN